MRSASEVELVNLTDPSSCIRATPRVRGALVIWDDGSVPDLSALRGLKAVDGYFVVFGAGGRSVLASLEPLGALEVRGRGGRCGRAAVPAGVGLVRMGDRPHAPADKGH